MQPSGLRERMEKRGFTPTFYQKVAAAYDAVFRLHDETVNKKSPAGGLASEAWGRDSVSSAGWPVNLSRTKKGRRARCAFPLGSSTEEALAQLSVQTSSILHQVPARDAANKNHFRYAGLLCHSVNATTASKRGRAPPPPFPPRPAAARRPAPPGAVTAPRCCRPRPRRRARSRRCHRSRAAADPGPVPAPARCRRADADTALCRPGPRAARRRHRARCRPRACRRCCAPPAPVLSPQPRRRRPRLSPPRCSTRADSGRAPLEPALSPPPRRAPPGAVAVPMPTPRSAATAPGAGTGRAPQCRCRDRAVPPPRPAR
jgi:hypothetical protein